MAVWKIEICLKKKNHPSTNIPLLSLRKSKQQEKENKTTNKTARIRAKPWMFRLPFKVYGAVITFKNSMKYNKIKKKISKIWNFFNKNHPPHAI